MEEVLVAFYFKTETISLRMGAPEAKDPRFFELQLNNFTVNKQQYRVATFHDVTEGLLLARAEHKSKMVELLSSSVSHEMLTPLKCIASFANSLQKELRHNAKRKDAELIYVTSKLLLSQVTMLLDRNLFDTDMFSLSPEPVPINRIVADTVQIISHQAELRNITIELDPLHCEAIINIDALRVQ